MSGIKQSGGRGPRKLGDAKEEWQRRTNHKIYKIYNKPKILDIKKQGTLFSTLESTKLVRNVFEKCFDDKNIRSSDDATLNEVIEGEYCSESSEFIAANLEDEDYRTTRTYEQLSSELGKQYVKRKVCSKIISSCVEWLKKAPVKYNGNQKYTTATIDHFLVQQGDYVALNAEEPNEPHRIAKICHMFDTPEGDAMFHGHFFCRGVDTILGETANSRELFVVDDCDDYPLGCIIQKVEVIFKPSQKDWAQLGNTVGLPLDEKDNGKHYYFSKIYDYEFSRFKDYVEEEEGCESLCISCTWQNKLKRNETAIYKNDQIKWRSDIFIIGTAVFLEPGQSKHVADNNMQQEKENCTVDNLHTELYRKSNDINKGSNLDTPQPFTIGIIEEIKNTKSDIKIRVRMFYRPEDTNQTSELTYTSDVHYLFWSNHVIWAPFKYVAGKCFITYAEEECLGREWAANGPYRFYYTKAYNHKTHKMYNVPLNGKKICCDLIDKENVPRTRFKSKNITNNVPVWQKLDRPLKCLDIYAGCGGLTEGLHQSGVAKTLWAIENDDATAQAYQMNNPQCQVITDDCNNVLKSLLSGNTDNSNYPNKGDVELVVGGPPCQGYSGMNRFSDGEASYVKNSQLFTFLSYIDFYRPQYFLFENVKNFVNYKRSRILKLTLKCLLAIGYQISFGIVQGGNFGIPQTRRRFILMGAAPGLTLPNFPEPLHVFSKSCLSIVVDGLHYDTGSHWTSALPYRTICVKDAIADLPAIENGATKTEIAYDGEAKSYYQKYLRQNNTTGFIQDHICKEMSIIVEARISRIPTCPGADWRDLPNTAVKLRNGTFTKVLKYPYRKKNQKRHDPPRGVCRCAMGLQCDTSEKQSDTLIPWFLVHTADRHNNWQSVYGRLDWDGFFGTTITNPDPTSTQGRVLHPNQNRVVSVRECARSQGFPDSYKFYGNVLDKHRQIGNAVPPPLALAFGREIIKACNQNN